MPRVQLFAVTPKLRGCDLVKLAVTDLVNDDRGRERVSVIQSKIKKPVQFELTEKAPRPLGYFSNRSIYPDVMKALHTG